MNYGSRMKKLRMDNFFTQQFKKKKLNIKRSTYKEYELQNSIIPIVHLNEFCNFFDVSIDFILGLSNTPKYKNSKKTIDLNISSKRLKELRKDNNLTQQKLAKILNVDPSTPSKYERQINPIATPYLYEIAKKYHISADYLLGKTDKPKYLR